MHELIKRQIEEGTVSKANCILIDVDDLDKLNQEWLKEVAVKLYRHHLLEYEVDEVLGLTKSTKPL